MVELPGRFQVVPGEPTLVLDVAHNPHAVAALAQNLDQMGFFPRTHAVFGAMRDKDIGAILARMAPLVDRWHFTDLPTARAASAARARRARCGALGARRRPSTRRRRHATPDARRSQRRSNGADPADRIVVFGSFYTVGGVLENGLPQRPAATPPERSGSPPAAPRRALRIRRHSPGPRMASSSSKRDPRSATSPRLERRGCRRSRRRTRARQRLIGAVVLLAIGIVGFPLVFETQPRPIPVDIPIEIPRRDALPPLAMPPAAVADAAGAGADVKAERARGAASDVHDCRRRTRADAGSATAATASSPSSQRRRRPRSRTRRPRHDAEPSAAASRARRAGAAPPSRRAAPASTAVAAAPAAPVAAAAPRPPTASALARCSKAAPVASADERASSSRSAPSPTPKAARETRKKVEKLGTEDLHAGRADDGRQRIRVRVGPFASRAEAERALAKVKAAGLHGRRCSRCERSTMTEPFAIGWVDIAMLGVIALSVLVGLVRGLIFEVLSLRAGSSPAFAAPWLGPVLAPHLPVGRPGVALERHAPRSHVRSSSSLIAVGPVARAPSRR